MTTLTKPGTVTTRRSSHRMWAILGLVLLADALDVIDATVTNIAAPSHDRASCWHSPSVFAGPDGTGSWVANREKILTLWGAVRMSAGGI